MKKLDFLSVLITFSVGLFVGGYLYVTGFADMMNRWFIPDKESISSFTVVGDMYGGCGKTCPSFQVTNNGSYRYLYTPSPNTNQVKREGALPLALQSQLKKALSQRELAKQSKVIDRKVCNSDNGANDVEYIITVEGVEYNIDSCTTAVDGKGKLWLTLNEVWVFFQKVP